MNDPRITEFWYDSVSLSHEFLVSTKRQTSLYNYINNKALS